MKFGLTRYTLDEFFDKVIEKYPNRPSLAFIGEVPFTYTELGSRVKNIQLLLTKLGIRKGDPVVLLGNSSPNWATAFLAIVTMGAVAVPILEGFPETDIDHIIRHSETKAAFIEEEYYNNLTLPSLEKIEHVVNLTDFSVLSSQISAKNIWDQIQEFPDKLKKSFDKAIGSEIKEHKASIAENDVAEILYTSGTTGHSKGVMLTHKNLVSNLFEGPDLLGVIDENSVILSFLPMAHAFGSTSAFLSIIYRGASIYYLKKKPSPKVLVAAMQKVQPTIIGGVPLIFEKIYHSQILPVLSKNWFFRVFSKSTLGKRFLYKMSGKKVMQAFGGRLKCAIIGGAGLNEEVELFMRWGGIPYALGYGLSECSPLVTFSSMEEAKIGSVGKPITDVSVKIVQKDPETGIGEILVRGPNVMKGYYKDEAATKKVFTDDGWFITGDRGIFDEDGFLYIKGRSKNVIVGSSGENIYPEVVEDILRNSLCVEEALVFMLNNQLVARIYPDYNYIQSMSDGQDENAVNLTIQDILEKIRTQANSQLPVASRIQKIIEQTEPFLKTPTNKIKRAEYVPDYLSS